MSNLSDAELLEWCKQHGFSVKMAALLSVWDPDLDELEEYRRRVKELGIFRVSKIPTEDFETLKKSWENWGKAWFCEVGDTEIIGDTEFKVVFLYYGSSSFSKQQMSRLIDNLVQDCKAIGIETKSPEEIESMLKEYDKKC